MVVMGWVEFLERGMTIQAILDDLGRWNCEAAPHFAELLNRDCRPVDDPADDAWARDALIKAAQQLRGTAWLGVGRPAN